MSLGESIKIMRQKAFYTQEALAKEINVAVSTVNRWESGKSKPNLTAMKAIKEFCERNKVSYEDIETAWFENN